MKAVESYTVIGSEEPARGREERQQEDVTERWWATNPKENVSSCAFLVLCSREGCVI
jgi:hypothetical protein